jgi:hypothetical protein
VISIPALADQTAGQIVIRNWASGSKYRIEFATMSDGVAHGLGGY